MLVWVPGEKNEKPKWVSAELVQTCNNGMTALFAQNPLDSTEIYGPEETVYVLY